MTISIDTKGLDTRNFRISYDRTYFTEDYLIIL